jgi:hypothetical protein
MVESAVCSLTNKKELQPANYIAFSIRAAHSEAACRRVYPDKQTMPLPSFEDVFECAAAGCQVWQ